MVPIGALAAGRASGLLAAFALASPWAKKE